MDLTQLRHSTKLGLFLVLAFVLYTAAAKVSLWRKRQAIKREKGTLPVNRYRAKDPIFGLDLLLDTFRAAKTHTFLETLRRRFDAVGSNTLEIVIRGRKSYSTIEPENLKTIQAIDFKKWGLPKNRKDEFHPLLGKGIFTTDGHEWQNSRDMLRPNFVKSQFGDIDMFEKHVSHLVAAIPRDGSTVDLSELFFRLTIDSATELLFDESTASLTKGSGEGFSAAFTASQEHTLTRVRWGYLTNLISPSKTFTRDVSFVHSFVDHYVSKGLSRRSSLLSQAKTPNNNSNNEGGNRYVFIDELVRQTPDPIRIRSELLNILLAGRDTTASLLTNAWWLLSRHPQVWRKLQSEISSSLGTVPPTYDQLRNLKYLRAILNEALRLYPVVPLNGREALEDTTLPLGGGRDGSAPMFVEKGTRVSWSTYAMHRRKDFYGEDAEGFRPERWLDDEVTGEKGLRPGWEYLPFNGGARICLGQQYALTEAGYTTVRLCQAFEGIEPREEGNREWTEMLTLTCVNLYGARVGLRAREG